MKNHALFVILLFLKKQQNLKLSSAANYRWSFKSLDEENENLLSLHIRTVSFSICVTLVTASLSPKIKLCGTIKSSYNNTTNFFLSVKGV